ncbi:hypothetical protein RFI_12887 [Reticulomyxa filosa]|uniref:Uncharacterized protein n=1 Tax=Reticulomyxa filosa TaxID=46433 RepID=X6NE70_RETFI|nr:hypothetical protein RFI_12887 [Reticulomyxa filosa]|eukprot:ETO24271.1 hypothetical protein RFI_12887 [Reticulomyxa filosa]
MFGKNFSFYVWEKKVHEYEEPMSASEDAREVQEHKKRLQQYAVQIECLQKMYPRLKKSRQVLVECNYNSADVCAPLWWRRSSSSIHNMKKRSLHSVSASTLGGSEQDSSKDNDHMLLGSSPPLQLFGEKEVDVVRDALIREISPENTNEGFSCRKNNQSETIISCHPFDLNIVNGRYYCDSRDDETEILHRGGEYKLYPRSNFFIASSHEINTLDNQLKSNAFPTCGAEFPIHDPVWLLTKARAFEEEYSYAMKYYSLMLQRRSARGVVKYVYTKLATLILTYTIFFKKKKKKKKEKSDFGCHNIQFLTDL